MGQILLMRTELGILKAGRPTGSSSQYHPYNLVNTLKQPKKFSYLKNMVSRGVNFHPKDLIREKKLYRVRHK